MWESLNGRNQPLIQVAPAIVHETKLQHREVWELEWVLTVGWFWVVPLWPTVWLLTSLFIICVMAKIGYSAFKKLNRTWAAVRSHRLFVHSDVWELWSRPHFARLRHFPHFLSLLRCPREFCAHIPLMFVGVSDCSARHLHPLSFFFTLSVVGSAQPMRRAPASVAAVQLQSRSFRGTFECLDSLGKTAAIFSTCLCLGGKSRWHFLI